jgi:hypothetical protein
MSVKFPDGATLTEAQLFASAALIPEINEISVQFERATSMVRVFVESQEASLSTSRVRSVLLQNCLELGDAVRNDTVRLQVIVGPPCDQNRSARGKLRSIEEV